MLVKHTVIACLDTIIEKYGKKNIEGILAAVSTVTSSHGIDHSDRHVQIISLLCLTSAVEILGPDAIPLIPGALTVALKHLETSVTEDEKAVGLHNAVYSFLDALFVHLAWIMTASYLDRVLRLSHKSAEAGLDESSNENRCHTLRIIVRQVAAKDCFSAIKRSMADAIAAGPLVRGKSKLDTVSSLIAIIGYKRAPGNSSSRYRKASKIHYHQAGAGLSRYFIRSIRPAQSPGFGEVE